MSLQSFVESFTVQAPTGRLVTGMPVELVAAPSEILDVATVEVVTGQVDLELVFKHVQLPRETGVTAWPPPAAPSVISQVSAGLAAAPQAGAIEGWLASITGTVPVGTRDISDQIRITFEWCLTDLATKKALADFAVVGGALDADRLTFAVPPVVTELTSTDFNAALTDEEAAPVRRIGVQVLVRGRIGTTVDTGFFRVPVPPLELPFFPVPIPSVAALFRDAPFAGDAVLLMVPGGSVFSTTPLLMGALTPLRELLRTIDATASVAAWATGTRGLFSAVDVLATRVPLTKNVGFLARNADDDLGKHNFIDGLVSTDIEDRGSSCLLVSANRAIDFFEDDDFDGRRLGLDAVPVSPDRFGGASIRNLHVSNPGSNPPGCVTTTGTPDGGDWGEVISSYRWGAAG